MVDGKAAEVLEPQVSDEGSSRFDFLSTDGKQGVKLKLWQKLEV